MRKISAAAAAAALVALGSYASPASAAGLVTLGQVAPGSPPAKLCAFSRQEDFWQEAAVGNSYTVPSAGVILSWSTNASPGDGQIYTFKVLRPMLHERLLVVGHDGPRTLTPAVLNTFKTLIPVKAGDIMALNYDPSLHPAPHLDPETACVFRADPADVIRFPLRATSAADGEVIEGPFFSPETEQRLNASATFMPAPTISSLTPSSGDVAGGLGVVIAGSNFTDVKGVSFGSVPAQSFKVDSETRISAVAPPAAAPGKVKVTVTAFAGSATSTFSYAAPPPPPPPDCIVPKLKGKRLKAARKLLKKANCRLGKVKRAHGARARTGRVAKQAPKPGTARPPEAKVNVRISPPKRRAR